MWSLRTPLKVYFPLLRSSYTSSQGNHVAFEPGWQDPGNDRGRLWISEKALDEFKHHAVTKDGEYICKVDEEYQYGQASKDGKGRFLVYHNKNNTPYQVSHPTSVSTDVQ